MRTVHLVVPEGIDDPRRPSGGNAYDRRVSRELQAIGWTVLEHQVPGTWPDPDTGARAGIATLVTGLPAKSIVLVDGIIASSIPDVLVPQALRLHVVVLMHMPLGCVTNSQPSVRNRERDVLRSVSAVVTTSTWTRGWLVDHYSLEPRRVHVAAPGVDPAAKAPGTSTGGSLLCVAAITHDKGHDDLLTALARVSDLEWDLTCVGALDRDPEFVGRLRDLAERHGIADRVRLVGPCTGPRLTAAFAGADVLVLASRTETYGMVVTEALARGLPVLAMDVGGISEALGTNAAGLAPGLLAPAGDSTAMGSLLRRWLSEPALRDDLRYAAQERRASLGRWSTTSDQIAAALAPAAA